MLSREAKISHRKGNNSDRLNKKNHIRAEGKINLWPVSVIVANSLLFLSSLPLTGPQCSTNTEHQQQQNQVAVSCRIAPPGPGVLLDPSLNILCSNSEKSL